MASLIELKNVTKTYGDIRALDNITLDIPAGKIVGLVGPNGAGKTTLLRALTGELDYQGEAKVLGFEPRDERAELMQKTGVIHDIAVLPDWFKISDLIDFMVGVHPGFSQEKAKTFLEATTISLNKKVKTLSKGMKTQLHLALTLATETKLLILDEPTHGLDILFRKQLYSSVLEDYFDEEKSLLISTHQIEEVEHILSDVIFIQKGQVLLYASIEELGERFTQLTIPADKADALRKELKPMSEYSLLGRKVFLLENPDTKALAKVGDLQTPSVADIFVALMGGAA
ncbi:MAG: ABC transporter ATP-binding protein [Candidatus Marinimicrobia bacterium]|nr:ABC transporter ATP-binding protein [Candidatus Neomarinimicrobiota bacterium]MCF7850624.1 ABC transporter ATP-binding protein [Candidatus Neomarinimicrobiota bacterium]MCF7903642.1 ABC transporter ATP-binding protein [Candidatus Neomarinimicrobiota bacterium]